VAKWQSPGARSPLHLRFFCQSTETSENKHLCLHRLPARAAGPCVPRILAKKTLGKAVRARWPAGLQSVDIVWTLPPPSGADVTTGEATHGSGQSLPSRRSSRYQATKSVKC